MTSPKGNSEFCFPRIPMFPETESGIKQYKLLLIKIKLITETGDTRTTNLSDGRTETENTHFHFQIQPIKCPILKSGQSNFWYKTMKSLRLVSI